MMYHYHTPSTKKFKALNMDEMLERGLVEEFTDTEGLKHTRLTEAGKIYFEDQGAP